LRLTAMVAIVAALGLGALALVATLVDSQLRAGESDAYRQGLASRLAAYIWIDEEGVWHTDGVVDDVASSSADAFLVATRAGEVLYSRGEMTQFDAVLAAGVADFDEVGVQGVVSVNEAAMPASAAPFWEGDSTAGAIVLATEDTTGPEHRRLRLLVWSTALGLAALSGLAAWILAGRAVRPMGAALDREERFLATAAHEIRTPLGRIRALAESAQRTARSFEESPVSRQLNGELHRMVEASVDAASSASDLLLAGRIDAHQLQMRHEDVRLDTLVADFEESIPSLAVAAFDPATVSGDPLLLRHAISDVVVLVTDNGPGLGDLDPTTIFDRHVRGSSGSGIGLWIAKTVIEEHGGTIRAANRGRQSAADPSGNGVSGLEMEIRLPSVVSR